MESPGGKGNEKHHRGEIHLSATISSNQDGEHSVCERLASNLQDSPEIPKVGGSESKHNSSSTLHPKPLEELPRLNFQIPRKNKEKRALFQNISSDSREFADIMKTIATCYKDAASAGTFVYDKLRLVHNELLEKEFVEKRKELKQDGRTEKELSESFCFLLCDAFKIPGICEKGLTVGHSWMSMLGHPSKGVYLSKCSDLLQVSPFDVGATGEIIIFKVIKGKVKSIYENMSKSLDPTPKFDSHYSKNANRVTSLQSYRAFELTQQYFYEYCDFEISSRPRHVCPFAVVSFQYKGKEAAPVSKPVPLLRSNSLPSGTGRTSYTVWRGCLMNGGKEVFQVCLRSHSQPLLPFKLPDKVEIGTVISQEQLTQEIPSALFSWDLYSGSHEVYKSGLYCSLFEVVEKSKAGSSLTLFLEKLEGKRMVLVSPVIDKGFLFILSSTQMANSNERRGGWKNTSIHALFIFPEARDVSRFSFKPRATAKPLLSVPQDLVMTDLDTFIPALHYALCKVRCNPPGDLSVGVEQQAHDYLSSRREGKPLQRIRVEYDHKLDEREKLFPAPRQRLKWESYLHSYFYGPKYFMMPVQKAKDLVEKFRCVPEPSPVTESENLDDPTSAARRNGQHHVQAHEDPERLKELLKLIQMSKKKERAKQAVKDQEGTTQTLKRKLEEETLSIGSKCLRKSSLNNGDQREEEVQFPSSLAEVINCVGLHDTDLRKDKSQGALKLMKWLDTLSRATENPSSLDTTESRTRTDTGDPASAETTLYDSIRRLGLPTNCDIDLRNRFSDDEQEEQETNDPLEEETTGSLSSLEAFSPCSDTNGQRRGVEMPGERSIPWVLIPITGLKTERYCQRQEDNPEDPRCLQTAPTSTHTVPEKSSFSPPELPDSSFMEEEPVEVMEVQNTNLTDELKSSHCQDRRTPLNDVDSIVDEQLCDFSSKMMSLLRGERVYYTPNYSSSQAHTHTLQTPMTQFSEYVSHFNTPLPVHGYVSTLHDSIISFIDSQQTKRDSTADTSSAASSLVHSSTSSFTRPVPAAVPVSVPSHTYPSVPASSSVPLAKPSLCSVPDSLSLSTSVTQPLSPHCSSPRIQIDQSSLHLQSKCDVKQPDQKVQRTHGYMQVEPVPGRLDRQEGRVVLESHHLDASAPLVRDADESMALSSGASSVEAAPASLSSVISQLQPEVISSLVEIIKGVQKNTVHFYIHSPGEEESDVCWEIKEYLKRLGNAECSPQTFLEKENSQDRLLIIIQNTDIAAQIHKIPALVSLKKLPSVSFAGVDNLDDIKNHTYNELFVSGGFIVSDEFVLNPDFITQERLQAFLDFLEELNTSESIWRWKVHCKTHKKLKEQCRVKREAQNLLNILTTFQRRNIVELLPYHECDAPSRQTPDLDCLVKLQAQYIQHRHIIFLTERRFEMFPQYSSNGIVIANIDDIMNSMDSLIGVHHRKDKPTPSYDYPSPGTSTLKTEDMSLDSEQEARESIPQDRADRRPVPPSDPYPPIADQLGPDPAPLSSPTTGTPSRLDFDALKSAISQFKASKAAQMQLDSNTGRASPTAFHVNPHQSFLSLGSLASSYMSSSLISNTSNSPTSSLSSVHMQSVSQEKLGSTSQSVDGGTAQSRSNFPNSEMDRAMMFRPEDGLSTTPRGDVQRGGAAGTIGSAGPVDIISTSYVTSEISGNNSNMSVDAASSPKDTVASDSSINHPDSTSSISETAAGQDLVTTSSSCIPQVKNMTTSKEAPSHASQAPPPSVPRVVGHGRENIATHADGMILQRNSLLSLPANLSSQGLVAHNGLRSPLLNSTVGLGVVGPTGFTGLLPNNNMQMAFGGLAQGGTSSMWGIQHGVGMGHVHQTQFIQSYAWRGNHPTLQGRGQPPHRGGYKGW
ncbi:protein TASOR [Chanos chanos]|uniref:Protein TASOR n=1 Tax=Chanos chanos TaxID=29144 RepID=A0A6J2VJH8_CHACN|nr:protein TASOR [Chanos chanos]